MEKQKRLVASRRPLSIAAMDSRIADLLVDAAGVGEWGSVLPLITADADSFPSACMLSASEIRWDGVRLRAVLRSRSARRNLQRSSRATLLVVGDNQVHSLHLRPCETQPTVDGREVIAFAIHSITSDGVGVPLRAMTFLRTDALIAREHAAANDALLSARYFSHQPPAETSPGEVNGAAHRE
jgi:hypothetical protein